MILIYLLLIIAANLSAAQFGPSVIVVNAFLLIGGTLTARDALHVRWAGRSMALKMVLLISAGGALSALLNAGAGRIAAASLVAFALSETMDSLVFHRLQSRPWMIRANGSNIAASIVDSLVFPTLAFGVFMPWIILGQVVAKIGGGYVWSRALRRFADE